MGHWKSAYFSFMKYFGFMILTRSVSFILGFSKLTLIGKSLGIFFIPERMMWLIQKRPKRSKKGQNAGYVQFSMYPGALLLLLTNAAKYKHNSYFSSAEILLLFTFSEELWKVLGWSWLLALKLVRKCLYFEVNNSLK